MGLENLKFHKVMSVIKQLLVHDFSCASIELWMHLEGC